MPIVTAQQVVDWTSISITEAEITAKGLIPVVQERATDYCNNWFKSEKIAVDGALTFNATAGTMVSGTNFATEGFVANDEIILYGSYRNDSWFSISGTPTTTLTIASSATVVAEVSGASVLVSLVQWPTALAFTAAQMVKYDYDDRKSRPSGLASQSLGPRSESYTNLGAYGYPTDILEGLDEFRMARLM